LSLGRLGRPAAPLTGKRISYSACAPMARRCSDQLSPEAHRQLFPAVPGQCARPALDVSSNKIHRTFILRFPLTQRSLRRFCGPTENSACRVAFMLHGPRPFDWEAGAAGRPWLMGGGESRFFFTRFSGRKIAKETQEDGAGGRKNSQKSSCGRR
jgi:hypothetical protein